MYKYLPFSFLFFLYTLSFTAYAQSNSYIMYERTADNADAEDNYFAAGIDFINNSQLQLSYGHGEASTLESSNYSIGLFSDPLADFSAGLSFLYSEQKNELEIQTYLLTLTRNTDNWSLSLTPQLGIITIYPLTTPSFETNRTGLGLNVSYYGGYPVFFSTSLQFYSYDRNLDALNINQYPRFSMRNFSMSTLDQAAGLEDNRFIFDIGYDFSELILGYYFDRSRSTVDDSLYTSHAIYTKFDLSKYWQLGFEAGRSKNSLIADSTTNYGSISITYNW